MGYEVIEHEYDVTVTNMTSHNKMQTFAYICKNINDIYNVTQANLNVYRSFNVHQRNQISMTFKQL